MEDESQPYGINLSTHKSHGPGASSIIHDIAGYPRRTSLRLAMTAGESAI